MGTIGLAYLLNSNTVIYARDGLASVLAKFVEFDGFISISAIVLAELQRGFLKAGPQADLRRSRLAELVKRIPVAAFDAEAARTYGRILAEIGWARGKDFDRMIAAHALSLNATLVTNNEADFAGIPGLATENWAVL